jgi:hypothetical protein
MVSPEFELATLEVKKVTGATSNDELLEVRPSDFYKNSFRTNFLFKKKVTNLISKTSCMLITKSRTKKTLAKPKSPVPSTLRYAKYFSFLTLFPFFPSCSFLYKLLLHPRIGFHDC